MTDSLAFYRQLDGIECVELPDGYAIYDHRREDVHFLNLTAAAVFDLCDGQSNAESIARRLQNAFSLPTPPEADVVDCLAALASAGLIEMCGTAQPSA